jgi:ABC-type multidrug transport system ATPase subunit
LDFHFSFKKPLPGLDTESMIVQSGLGKAADKPIYDYSSGMKQRVKLIQAIFADTPVLMLDEPCSNLDENGVNQYREWMERYATSRMVFVASNDPREYFFCREQLAIEDYQ